MLLPRNSFGGNHFAFEDNIVTAFKNDQRTVKRNKGEASTL